MSRFNPTLVVAVDEKFGIGIDNRLPWCIPGDMGFFRHLTTGRTVIMGRKTYDSIGRALKNRRNIVVTRNREWTAPGVDVVASVEQAFLISQNDAEVFVIGGSQIYAAALPYARRIFITHVFKDYGCDAFFPELDPTQWYRAGAKPELFDDSEQVKYKICNYLRREDKPSIDSALQAFPNPPEGWF